MRCDAGTGIDTIWIQRTKFLLHSGRDEGTMFGTEMEGRDDDDELD